MTEYRRLTGDNRTTLVEFLLKRPEEGAEIPDDFDVERSREPARELDLFD